MKPLVAYLTLSLAVLAGAVDHASAATPVHINFQNLPVGTVVSNQYPQVKFSSSNNIYYPITVVSQSNCYCATSSPTNYIVSYPANAYQEVYLDFTGPVNNLSFYIIASDSIGVVGKIDVFRNGTLSGTYNIYGNGNPYVPLFADGLRSLTNITRIRIYAITDAVGLGFDDFDFTPVDVEKVEITSGRVGGILNNTTQKAMLGADVALQANIFPTGLTGGTYSWTATGPHQRVSATSTSASYTGRWTDVGTYQAKVTYTRSGVTVSATVNVNVVVPILDNYTAQQEPSHVSGYGPPCAKELGTYSQYTLGCADLGFAGITFSSTVHIPTGPYLSDLNQSGIKYVQRVSAFRKQLNGGVIKCRTRRSSEGDNNSGWLFDGATADTYDTDPAAVRRFSEGSTLTILTDDSPGEALEGPKIQGAPPTPPGLNDKHQHDAFTINENFETFVVYFTSNSAALQRTVGKLSWDWGGEVVYDARVSTPYPYRRTVMFGIEGDRIGAVSNQSITYQGRTNDQSFVMDTCPGVPTPTPVPNLIDNSRFFVRQQYSDILNRVPDGAWLVWVSFITECGFDQACINRLRISVVRGFFESSEFRQSHPGFENLGSPQYNEAYVKQLYYTLLRRPPDGAWTVWRDYINQTGNYDGLVGGFINSSEYRNRQW